MSIINAEAASGNLVHPLGPNVGGDYPTVQYVDDTLLIMPADTEQLAIRKDLLNTFASSTRLKINFVKSFLIPINVEESK